MTVFHTIGLTKMLFFYYLLQEASMKDAYFLITRKS